MGGSVRGVASARDGAVTSGGPETRGFDGRSGVWGEDGSRRERKAAGCEAIL